MTKMSVLRCAAVLRKSLILTRCAVALRCAPVSAKMAEMLRSGCAPVALPCSPHTPLGRSRPIDRARPPYFRGPLGGKKARAWGSRAPRPLACYGGAR
jgi:hypothetical protein